MEKATSYGKFIEKNFTPVFNLIGRKIGMNMYMEFEPGDRVIDATKLGFIQTAETMRDGEHDVSSLQHPDSEHRSIDQLMDAPNPMYATHSELTDKTDLKKDKKAAKTNPLAKQLEGYSGGDVHDAKFFNAKESDYFRMLGRKKAGSGDFGYRYWKPDLKGFDKKNATFQDTPHMFGAGKDSHERFETAVVVIDGWQKGLYLGAVKWGWNRDKSGKFIPEPMELSSTGAPSEDFFRAADKWKGKTALGSNIAVPKSEGKIKTDKAKVYLSEGDVLASKSSKELPVGTTCRIIDEKMINNESYLFISSEYDDKNKTIGGYKGWIKESDVNSDIMFPNINKTQP